MKRMKRTISILLLFFVLIFNKTINAQSPSVYIHDFHIVESNNLTTSEKAQIDKAITNIKEYLKATLKGEYEILPDKASNMLTTDLKGMEVSYREEADYMVFGTVVYDKKDEYLIVSTQLYDILNKDYLRQKKRYKSEGPLSVWNTREDRLEKIDEILKNVFPNIKNNELEVKRQQIEIEKKEAIERQEAKEREEREKKEEEDRKRAKAQEAKERKEREKKAEEYRKRAEAQEENERIRQEKREKRRKTIPAVGTMTAGAVMGGIGIYWRMQALGLYDDYEIDVDAGFSNANGVLDNMLEDARKPNRKAHIIGAGGMLVGGIGIYMWMNRKKKKTSSETTSTRFPKIKIEPHVEYNTHSNTNTVHAKMTYTF